MFVLNQSEKQNTIANNFALLMKQIQIIAQGVL